MRLLLDERVPKRLRRDLPGHSVATVQEMGWSGVQNGELLRLAGPVFDAFITVDQGIPYQQKHQRSKIAVVLLVAPSNDLDDLPPLVPELLNALRQLKPGSVQHIRRAE